jgi:hypothetical protein
MERPPEDTSTNFPSIDAARGSRVSDPRSYSYYKALHDLKEVNEQIMIFKKRIKLIAQKE